MIGQPTWLGAEAAAGAALSSINHHPSPPTLPAQWSKRKPRLAAHTSSVLAISCSSFPWQQHQRSSLAPAPHSVFQATLRSPEAALCCCLQRKFKATTTSLDCVKSLPQIWATEATCQFGEGWREPSSAALLGRVVADQVDGVLPDFSPDVHLLADVHGAADLVRRGPDYLQEQRCY